MAELDVPGGLKKAPGCLCSGPVRASGSSSCLETGPAMHDVYLICLVLGAAVLIVQTILGLLGVGDVLPGAADADVADGFDLLSVRSLSAGATLLGAVGLWLSARGMPLLISAPAALAAGAAAAAGTAFVTRQMMRLESDGTLRLENAVGQSGTVYLTVPARGEGHGLVQFTLQGRTVELRAVSDDSAVIPTGTAVVVVSLREDDIVEVMPTPLIEGIDA